MKTKNPSNTPARSTTWGTSHFESRTAAIAYYRPYLGDSEVTLAKVRAVYNGQTGLRWKDSRDYLASRRKDDATEKAVAAKLAAGEIHIGPPTLKPGQKLSLHREERRYFITETTAS